MASDETTASPGAAGGSGAAARRGETIRSGQWGGRRKARNDGMSDRNREGGRRLTFPLTFGLLLFLVVCAPVLCSPILGGRGTEGGEASGADLDRVPFPELREAFRGSVVLLHFWASWCGHCAAEVPHLKELRRRFQEGDFEIIGVCLDSGPPRVAHRWLRRHRISWPQIFDVRDYRGELSRRLGITFPPANLLLDREGAIVARNLPPENLFEAVRKAIEEGAGRTTR